MVSSTETINTKDFLFLKQLLCLIALTRLRKVVRVDRLSFERDDLEKEAKTVLLNIQQNLIFPTQAMRSGFSHVNFNMVNESAAALVDQRENNLVIRNVIKGQVTESQIYSKPEKAGLFEALKEDFCVRNKLYDSRAPISSVLKNLDSLFNTLFAYLSYDDAKINVSMAIAIVNMIESVEYTFQLSEDGEEVFWNDPDKIMIKVTEHD